MEREDFDLQGLRRGDRDAWEKLFSAIARDFYRLICEKVGSDNVEDVLQETAMQVFRRIDQFGGLSLEQFCAWIRAIAVNKCNQWWRKSEDHQPLPENDLSVNPSSGPVGHLLQSEERERLHEALNQIEPTQREVLLMRYFDGLDGRQIAEILGRPVGTIGRWLHEGRNSLRRILGG